MARVRVEHLGLLADGANGAFTIGELVRQLVYAWVADRVAGMSFHAGSANNLHEWDGHVSLRPETGSNRPFLSVWELSVKKNAIKKVRDDFSESFDKEMPFGWTREETTYVAVTLRKLAAPDLLRRELLLRNDGRWKDVQIIDAPALEQWLEKCPAVEDWCAEFLNIGGGKYGLSLSQFWQRWSTSTDPAMTKEFVLAGRHKFDRSLLTSPVKETHVGLQFDEPREGVAFVKAVIDSIEDEILRDSITANALVISDYEKAEKYAQDFVIRDAVPVTILMAPANRAANTLKAAKHFVISIVGRDELSNSRREKVPRAIFRDLAQALETTMDMSQEEAFRQARAAGGSVPAWITQNRRKHGTFGNVPPLWAEPPRLKASLSAILCGGWNSSSELDKAVIEELSGVGFEEFKEILTPLFRDNSALLEQQDDIVYVIAPTVSFLQGSLDISDILLKRFAQVVRKVFVDNLGGVDLSGESSSAFSSFAVPRHSEWITLGLAETVLRISAFAEELDGTRFGAGPRGCQAFADEIVASIAGKVSEPAFLVALDRHLPIFMEASPEAFLNALEASLERAAEDVDSEWRLLFKDIGFGWNSRNDYLLNGLESLAWSPEHLQQVIHVLMLLSKFALNDKGEYRTLRSLQGIFEALSPGTSANLHKRVEVLDAVADVHPEVTWALCKRLLPKMMGTYVDRTGTPLWKDFGRSTIDVVDDDARSRNYEQYINIALTLSEDNPVRQHDLLSSYPLFAPSQQATLRRNITNTSEYSHFPDEMRAVFADTLKKMVRQHRRFTDVSWALPETEILHLEALRTLFEPRDLVEKILELLDEFPWDYYDDDYQASQQRTQERLRTSIRELVSLNGIELVLDLNERCKRSYSVIEAISNGLSRRELRQVVKLGCSGVPSERTSILVGGLSRRLHYFVGPIWANVVSKMATRYQWMDDAFSACLNTLPYSANLSKVLEDAPQAVRDAYWQCRDNVLTSDGDFKNEVALKLIEYGRATSLMIQPLKTLAPATALRILDAVIIESAQNSDRIPQNVTMVEHTVNETLAWLSDCEEVSEDAIVALEYRMMPLLSYSERPLLLHEALAEDPERFIQILSHVYLPEDTSDDYVASEAEKKRAEHAWNVLDRWKKSPGLDKNGVVNPDKLVDWVKEAREHGKTAGRVRIADYYIGKALYNVAKVEPGHAWPPEYLCQLLEEVASSDLEEGLVLQAFNSRGVTRRSFGEGGLQEQELAARWTAQRDLLDMKWRRARRICAEIADGWKSQAQSMDRFSDIQQLRMNR